VITDANWIENRRRVKEGFFFFHAPHQRISDTGYLRYVFVANQLKRPREDRFFVVNGPRGDKIAREFRIPGWPALFYYKNPTGKNPEIVEYHGPMSKENLYNFIYNYTWAGFKDIDVSDTISYQDIIRLSFRDEFETASTGFIFGKNDTKFERVCEQFAKEHSNAIRFFRVQNENAARNLGLRIPSMLIFRIEDHEMFVYKGEPKLSIMNDWYKKVIINGIHISEFDQRELFELSGITLKTVVDMIPREERIGGNETFKSLLSLYHYRTPLLLRYADPTEMRAMFNLFELDPEAKRICISSNYTRISAYDCSNVEPFTGNYQSNVKVHKTPSELYNGIAVITETSFEKFVEDGPSFVLFVTNKNCPMCPSMEYYFEESYSMAREVAPANTSFAIWYVTDVNRPSFAQRISIDFPSLYYFPTQHFSESRKYSGERDINPIKNWIITQIEGENKKVEEDYNPTTEL
jgi:hypothetical protein